MKKLKKLTALAGALLLTTSIFAGCSSGSSEDKKELNLYMPADYIDETLLDKFEDETGIEVVYNTFETNEIMYQKLKGNLSSYDLLIPSDYMIEKLIKEDMLEKIDFNNIPNYSNIGDKYKSLAYDPNNEYSVPYMWGTIGILYNADVVTEKVDSWDILWNEKYSGEIFLFDSLRDTLAISLARLGYSINSTNPDEINEAAEELIKQKPLLQSYVMDEVKDNMVNGGAAIATVYSGDAIYIQAEAQDMNFEYVVPKEGSNKWFDAMVIPKGSENKAEAEALINFLSDPENAKVNVEYIGYSTPNTSAFELLDEETKNNKTAYPDESVLENTEVFRDLGEDIKLYDDAWLKVKMD